MSDQTLRDLVSTNCTGDAEGYDRELLEQSEARLLSGVTVFETTAPVEPTVSVEPVPATESKDTKVVVEDTNKKLTKEEAEEIRRAEKEYRDALAFVKDAVAPSMMRVDPTRVQIGDTYIRTFFTYAYPDFLEGNWLSPIINWDVKFDMSMFIYPVESAYIMKYLKKRLTELNSERSLNADRGLVSDPALDAQVQDVEELRASLTR